MVRGVPKVDPSETSRRPLILTIAAVAVVLLAGFLYLRDTVAPEHAALPAESIPTTDSPLRNDRLDRLRALRETYERSERASGSGGDSGGRMAVPSGIGASSDAPRPRPRPNTQAGPQADATDHSPEQMALDEDPDDIPSLRRMALEDADAERRLAAVTLLGASDDPQAIPILAQALQDQDEEVRLAAIQSLADATGEVPISVLGNAALNDPSPDNRYEALEVLSDLGGDAARSYIERATHDPDEDVSEFAKGLLDDDTSYDEEESGE
jgi:hypothetical protein